METVDLLVIGPGVLGLSVAKKWKLKYPKVQISLKFKSHNLERSESLVDQGFNVISAEKGEDCNAKYVLFCAPPTDNLHYSNDIEKGLKANLVSTNSDSLFIFTSSASIYTENNGGIVDENSPVSEGRWSLVSCENMILENDGCVLRLGALYTRDRGVHSYYSKTKSMPSKTNGFINFLHYDDAADLITLCFENSNKLRSQLFLVSDGIPVTRETIVKYTYELPENRDKDIISLTGGDGVDGRQYNVAKVKQFLNWKPSYISFIDFMHSCTQDSRELP